jgi:hypothetical protein
MLQRRRGLHVRGPGGQRRRRIEDPVDGPEPVYRLQRQPERLGRQPARRHRVVG